MSRPEQEPTNSSESGWDDRLNDNFEKVFDVPLSLGLFASVPILTSAYDPKLYEGCWAVIGTVIYVSDGSVWSALRDQLNNIPDLDTGTATVLDIQTAYNGLLADMQLKGWML